MKSFREEEEDMMVDARKINLIDNLDNLGLTKPQRNRFIKFYYNNLDMNLLEALEEFKNATHRRQQVDKIF